MKKNIACLFILLIIFNHSYSQAKDEFNISQDICSVWGDTTIVLYDFNNDTSKVFSIKNNLLNGRCIYYFKGKKILEFCVLNGKYEGAFLHYDKEERVKSIDWFKRGYLLGGRQFYKSGQIKLWHLPDSKRLYYGCTDSYSKRGKLIKSKYKKEYPLAYYLALIDSYYLKKEYMGDEKVLPDF